MVSIANKLGIFNKGKASAKAAFAMPSLSFNETKFLKDGTGKTSRVADPLKTAVAKDNKNLRDGTKKEDAGKISEFFALDDDRQASKERTKPRDADPPNVLLDDVLPPPDVPKISAGKILIPEAKSSAESEASPKAAPVAQSLPRPLETEDAVVVDASHFLRKKASKPREHYRIDENDKENSVPPSNPIEKAPTAKPVAEIHGAEPVEKRSSTGIRKHQAIIDMEAASRLVEGLENTYEAGDYAEPNEETIEDYPYAADWEEPICEETCNDGVEEEYYGDDGVDQLGWEARYLDAFHDEANGNIGFDVMLGPGDDHLTEQFGFEDHDVSAPWDEQVQFSQYSSSAINQQGNLRLSGASSGLPWRSTKPAASRQSLALKHSTPLSIQHASWRSVAESLSNRAASDEGLSRRGSIGPFGRPNHLF